MTEPDWTTARAAMMLDPRFINLNTGSFGPTPRRVFERATELRRQLAAAPMEFLLRTQPPLLWHARQRLATFVGTAPERLIFTANVTVAINLVASALKLAAPGEVLLSDHEYGSMYWCWERACQRQGLTLLQAQGATVLCAVGAGALFARSGDRPGGIGDQLRSWFQSASRQLVKRTVPYY